MGEINIRQNKIIIFLLFQYILGLIFGIVVYQKHHVEYIESHKMLTFFNVIKTFCINYFPILVIYLSRNNKISWLFDWIFIFIRGFIFGGVSFLLIKYHLESYLIYLILEMIL